MAEGADRYTPKHEEGARKAWAYREVGGKTVWDWLQLLVVPVMLSLITVAFTWQQSARQQRIEDQRAQQAQEIEERRAEAEREIQEQRAQQSTFQMYLDQMGGLLLDRGLRSAGENSDVRRLARARTLVVLESLGAHRQNRVLRFLEETELIQARASDRPPIISLKYASLRDFELNGKQLLANLRGAWLSGAYLHDADLSHADLTGADLSDARGRFESGARMSATDLGGADLSGADLTNAAVTTEQLRKAASLKGATMPGGQAYEDWLKEK